MYISDCLQKYFSDLEYQIINERPVDALGILEADYKGGLCSFLEDKKYVSLIPSNVYMIFLTEQMLEYTPKEKLGYIIVKQPRVTFFQLHNAMKAEAEYIRKLFDTKISSDAEIGKWVEIPNKNVIIGRRVKIEPFVTIYENTVIEDDCIIRSGARIGETGFEQKRVGDRIFSVEHLGGTILQKSVEIQNNTCIDRAIYPWDNTIVGEYTKIDNLVHIGHAVKIGRSCMIVAQSGIGGRTVIGNNVWIGFGSTIRNGITIGNNARVNMGSVVSKNVAESESVTGNFAIPHEQFIYDLKKKSRNIISGIYQE